MSIHSILTVDNIADWFLGGVRLCESDKALIRTGTSSAVKYYESETGLVLGAHRDKVFTDKFDTVDTNDLGTWFLNRADHRPIREVTKVQIQFGTFQPVELPVDWIQISSDIGGQIQVVPSEKGLASYSFTGGAPLFASSLMTGYSYFPNWLQLSYKAGFASEMTGTATVTPTTNTVTVAGGDVINELETGDWVTVGTETHRVDGVQSATQFTTTTDFESDQTSVEAIALRYDPMLIEGIGMKASILALAKAGDEILGDPGIASRSVAQDGVSVSVATTASAMYAGYSARLEEYRKRELEIRQALVRRYRSIDVWMV